MAKPTATTTIVKPQSLEQNIPVQVSSDAVRLQLDSLVAVEDGFGVVALQPEVTSTTEVSLQKSYSYIILFASEKTF